MVREKFLNKLEISLMTDALNKDSLDLIPFKDDADIRSLNCIINYIISGTYQDILNMNPNCVEPLNIFLKKNKPVFRSESKSNFLNVFHLPNENNTHIRQLILQLIAISALQEFVRANLCGPSFSDENIYSMCDNFLPVSNESILDALSKDGESVLTKIHQPKLLYLSLILFHSNEFDKCITHKWWLFRCLFIHQQLITERVPELHKSIMALIESQKKVEFLNNKEEPLAEIYFYSECAHIHLHYHEVKLAEEYIKSAQDILSLDIELIGAIGKRTKYQSKAVAQLLLKTKRNENQYYSKMIIDSCLSFPQDLLLQDDTLLNKIEIVNLEDDTTSLKEILPEEQIVILAYCCLMQRKMAVTELKDEEIISYINHLLLQPKIWSLHVKALLLRCQVEKNLSRKFDRALAQLEELINAIKKEDPPFSSRQVALYSVAFPLKYSLEKFLAELFMSIGSVKSALEIYERLQLWEETIVCYKELGMTLKAKEILEKLISIKPSPVLWCYLGDVLDDPEKYVIAWELSEHKNARAQRCLAYYYFKRKDYQLSLEHFDLTTKINYLQPTVWFSFGYAATACEQFELAARAYHQVVLIDDDNFEAWNNLSNAYIKLKQKDRAYNCLKEALKCNYEEWRVWENFLLVSTDVGAFEDVIRAYHRLLDIKHKYVDIEVLQILVKAIDKDLPDFSDSKSSRLKDTTLKLFERLTSITTNNPAVCELYSILQCSGFDYRKDKAILKIALDLQKKAMQYYSQDSYMQGNDSFTTFLKAALRLADLYLALIELLPIKDFEQKITAKQAELSLKNIIIKAEKACLHFKKETDCYQEIVKLKSALETIKNICSADQL